jgi:hypothetical protein
MKKTNVRNYFSYAMTAVSYAFNALFTAAPAALFVAAAV